MRESFPKRIGILGGGQLARLLALECYGLGLTPVIYSSQKSDSAAQVVSHWVQDDNTSHSLSVFLQEVDVVAIENEFTDLKKLKFISQVKPLFPSVESLALVQDKFAQKQQMQKSKIPTSEFLLVNSKDDLEKAFSQLGDKLVLKKSTLGYDGRGTFVLKKKSEEALRFFDQNFDFRGYAEKYIPFKKELAAIVARDSKGKMEVFPVVETFQQDGMCSWVIRPIISSAIEKKAQALAIKVMKSFNGIGVYAVEMFLTGKNQILVNEIAPRVHNSGHITLDACNVSQFEQHLRAMAAMPLVKPRWIAAGAAMVNIIGEMKESKALEFDFSACGLDSHVCWYGKSGYTFKRKLGHMNVLAGNSKKALQMGMKMRRKLTV